MKAYVACGRRIPTTRAINKLKICDTFDRVLKRSDLYEFLELFSIRTYITRATASVIMTLRVRESKITTASALVYGINIIHKIIRMIIII